MTLDPFQGLALGGGATAATGAGMQLWGNRPDEAKAIRQFVGSDAPLWSAHDVLRPAERRVQVNGTTQSLDDAFAAILSHNRLNELPEASGRAAAGVRIEAGQIARGADLPRNSRLVAKIGIGLLSLGTIAAFTGAMLHSEFSP